MVRRAVLRLCLAVVPLVVAGCANGGGNADDPLGSVQGRATGANFKRTVVFIYGQTQPGQDMFVRGGLDHGQAQQQLGITCTAANMLCSIPLVHRNSLNATTQPWKVGDSALDWYGAEAGQTGVSHGITAQGTAVDWTTDVWPAGWGPQRAVATDGYGVEPLNQYGPHYWMLDVDLDCSRGFPSGGESWFELKSYVSNGPGWEGDISQPGAPYTSINHFAQCGRINVFRRGENPAQIIPFDGSSGTGGGSGGSGGGGTGGSGGGGTVGTTVTIGAAGDIDGTAGVQNSDIMFFAPNDYQAVLTLGDNSYQSDYASFNSGWGRLKSKMYMATGNHDYSYLGSYNSALQGAAGGMSNGNYYYSFNLGDWHLIAIDSSADMSANSPQVNWLKADLAANAGKKCTLAFWHHPRWSSGSGHGNQNQASAVWDALYAANADLVLGGHDHTYERFGPQNPSQQSDPTRGITEFVVGTGGAGFYGLGSQQPNSQFFQSNTHGILKLTLKPDGWDSVFVASNFGGTMDPSSGLCH
jgi:hypothetical protein